MNKSASYVSRDDRLLARLGGKYIFRMQAISQTISVVMSPIIGFYFIFIASDFSQIQFSQLLISYIVLIVLANLFISIYIRISSRQARARLDHIFKDRPLPENSDEIQAWKAILTLPIKAGIAHIAFSYFILILPVSLFMRFYSAANWSQILIILIGGTLVEMSAFMQSVLFMDARLAPTRRALLPRDPTQQSVRSGIRQSARPYFIIIFITIFSQLQAGVLINQKYIAASLPGANLEVILKQLQTQLGIIGAMVFIVGIFLASRLYLAASEPTREMARTIDEIQRGNFSRRAAIMSSDETAQLTIHLNQLLDQLQGARLELEESVEQRTSDLLRKTTQLQAATQVARDATSLQDINMLLSRTVDLISNQFGFYHTGIFLLDDTGDYAVLQSASSDGGKRMLARGHRLEVGYQGIVGAVVRENRPHITSDIGSDATFFKNPDLPTTRSEAAIPLVARGKVIGVLDIQSTEQSAFTQSDIEIFQILADQIALAIQNARLITESQNALQKLEAASAENIRHAWKEQAPGIKHAYRYTSVGLTPLAQAKGTQLPNEPDANLLNIPVTLRGQRIGMIALKRKSESAWNESDRSLAIEISNQVGLALENARSLDNAQRLAAREQQINTISAQIQQSSDLDVVLQNTIRELGNTLGMPNTFIQIGISSPENQDK